MDATRVRGCCGRLVPVGRVGIALDAKRLLLAAFLALVLALLIVSNDALTRAVLVAAAIMLEQVRDIEWMRSYLGRGNKK